MTVTNEVLLEKLTYQDEKLRELKDAQEKHKTSMDQNFSSLGNILKEMYVTKDQLQLLIDRIKILEAELTLRVEKEYIKPYITVLNFLGLAAMGGMSAIVGKAIWNYMAGGPPG